MRFRRFLRNRAIGITRRAVAPAARWRQDRAPATLELQQVRRRLELLLAGMYGRPWRVGAQGATLRAAAPGAAGAIGTQPDIVLPRSMDARDGQEAAAARYRLLAIQQGERVVRGSATIALPDSMLERDLYTLAEGAAVDRAIAERAPGFAGMLAERHAHELRQRPDIRRLSAVEREVELTARALLGGPEHGDALPSLASAEASLAWARATAARIRSALSTDTRYRGLPGMNEWRVKPAEREPDPYPFLSDFTIGERRPEEQDGADGESGEERADGSATIITQDAAEDREGAKPGADMSRSHPPRGSLNGISYPEWDTYAGVNRPEAVTVHDEPAAEGSIEWAEQTLASHAAIVRQVRARFGMLRARRTRLRAQRSGDELDLDACVRAMVDLRMRRAPSDRLYLHDLPARRTLAIALLVDVSGSTRATVADGQSILEVERMTVLLASEALDALGDPYAVLAFSGCGAHDVQIRTVKRFSGDGPDVVRRRIAGLAAMDNTRLGAAVRHATAVLNAQPAEQRLLLIVSDGKPNDVYGYQGEYAIEDSRRALADARSSGVHAFCLTVDREETEYLPHLFGASGYRVLRSPEQLPSALLRVVEQLLPR
ncbi:MAG TPA: VWA domain-containing protein [Gemmatimonadaceae bacterium]|nr:VWA domain-containing protein [Gemmatimonadaceae bacterium]